MPHAERTPAIRGICGRSSASLSYAPGSRPPDAAMTLEPPRAGPRPRTQFLLVPLVVALVACVSPVAAQPLPAASPPVPPAEAPLRRPTVGLALGGGAARGIAHAGILEWFEANHIPIDYVAGTSMGGLIGGAYATGMNSAEIRRLMREVDWDNVFLADSPYKFKTFRRREDVRLFPSQLKFGLKGGLKGPTGINPGQRIEWVLNRIALPFGRLDSFDELATPFRCVAADVIKAEQIVLGSGSLTTAMRATMAIPGVFTPVRMGGRLLVDGGALNNVPTDVVRAMGADLVIAVNVAADLEEENIEQTELSLFGVIGKTIDAMMTPPIRRALESADLVIDPDLRGLTSLDWRRSDEFADRGFAAAEGLREALLALRLDDDEWAAFQQRRAARTPSRTPTLEFVRVEGVADAERQLVLEAVAVRPGQTIDLDALEQSLAFLAGNDRYETISYQLVYEDGRPGMLLDVRPKHYAPPFLFIAFDLQNIDSSSFTGVARARAVFTDVLNPGSELRADVSIGSDQYLGAELFVPLRKARMFATLGRPNVFVAPRAYFDRRRVNGYEEGDLRAEYRFKYTGVGLDLGFTSGRRSEVRVGYDVRDVRGRRRVGDPVLPEAEGTDRFASLRFTFDGQNSPLVPTRGAYVRTSLARYFDTAVPTLAELREGEEEGFWQGEVRYSHFQRTRSRDRVFWIGSGGTSFGRTPLVNAYSLGGPMRLGSFSHDELRGANYLLAGAGYLKHWFRLPDVLGSDVLAGAWVETGSAFDRLRDAEVEASLSGGIVVETLLGPFFGGISGGTNSGVKVYVSLGTLFR